MKKVLEVFGEPISSGGQESFVYNAINGMNLDSIRVDFFTPYYCDNVFYKEWVEKIGGKIIAINLLFSPGASRINIIKPLDSLLKQECYDVVHVHSGSISVLAEVAFVARKNKVKKIIVHSHCAGDRKNMKYRVVKLLSTPILNHCPTHHIACSKVAGEWKFSKKIVNKRMLVLKNGVNLEKFAFNEAVREKMRSQLGIPNNAYVLGHVGRFSYQKNHEYLIELFEQVHMTLNNSYLVLIGSGENLIDIKQMVESKNLSQYVRFAGNVNNVNDYLQVMDVFVLPSRFEGLPIVGVEAQANGLPLLTSTSVSSELAITKAVEFIPLEDKDKWIRSLIALVNSKRIESKSYMMASGYSIEDTARILQKIYEE